MFQEKIFVFVYNFILFNLDDLDRGEFRPKMSSC